MLKKWLKMVARVGTWDKKTALDKAAAEQTR